MLYSNVLQFCADNPGVAFLLSWPVFLTLAYFSWSFTVIVTSIWSTLVHLVDRVMTHFTILVRGHAPVGSTHFNMTDKEMEEALKNDLGVSSQTGEKE